MAISKFLSSECCVLHICSWQVSVPSTCMFLGVKGPFLHFAMPVSVQKAAKLRCACLFITSWTSISLVTHPSLLRLFMCHSWSASTTLYWRKYCFPENGYLSLMVTVLYPRSIITIAVRFLQLISSSSALDDYMALLHSNIDLWNLVSEREETHKPLRFQHSWKHQQQEHSGWKSCETVAVCLTSAVFQQLAGLALPRA